MAAFLLSFPFLFPHPIFDAINYSSRSLSPPLGEGLGGAFKLNYHGNLLQQAHQPLHQRSASHQRHCKYPGRNEQNDQRPVAYDFGLQRILCPGR